MSVLWVRYARQARDFIKLANQRSPTPAEDRLLALEDAQRYLGMAITQLREVKAEWENRQAKVCPVCGANMKDPPQDWNICPNCWCEFAGDGDMDAKSGLPIEQYREKFRRGDFNERNAEYRKTLEESLRRKP